MKKKNKGIYVGSGNREQEKVDRQWKKRTNEDRKAIETNNNGRLKSNRNREQWKIEQQCKQRTMEGRIA